jgi:multiple sugar transport system permease protein
VTTSVMAGMRNRHRFRRRVLRACLHAFLIFMALLFAFPLLYAFYTSLRPYGEIVANPTGFFSLPGTLNFDNYTFVWNNAGILGFYWNTMVVAVPAVLLTLWISSMVAFAVSRFSWRFNLLVLMIFTAGNLLPTQVIIIPLYKLYNAIPLFAPLSDNGRLYDQFVGIILIHVVFQTGFCVFVFSNYMKTLSKELIEAAMMDGAGVFTIYFRIMLPLIRPAIAALATLEFVFIYNDFFWALFLFKSGDKRPITAALNNLSGAFFTDPTQLAAVAFLAAIPPVILYIVLQRQFIRGLTLGSAKG